MSTGEVIKLGIEMYPSRVTGHRVRKAQRTKIKFHSDIT